MRDRTLTLEVSHVMPDDRGVILVLARSEDRITNFFFPLYDGETPPEPGTLVTVQVTV